MVDALDLAVPKERLTQETEFQSSSLESLMTSSVEVDSESDMTYMMDSSSEEYLDDDRWKITSDDIMITEVVQLSGDEDVYRLVN